MLGQHWRHTEAVGHHLLLGSIKEAIVDAGTMMASQITMRDMIRQNQIAEWIVAPQITLKELTGEYGEAHEHHIRAHRELFHRLDPRPQARENHESSIQYQH